MSNIDLNKTTQRVSQLPILYGVIISPEEVPSTEQIEALIKCLNGLIIIVMTGEASTLSPEVIETLIKFKQNFKAIQFRIAAVDQQLANRMKASFMALQEWTNLKESSTKEE
jgi:hypothetical protein